MVAKQSIGVAATAESRFREAFLRLRDGCPLLLEPGCRVTQNNVAREAGCDPSALKKARFPTLVAEIKAVASKQQEVVGGRSVPRSQQSSQTCPRCASLRDQLLQLTRQRDAAMSALVQADAHVLELAQRVLQLEGTAGNDPNRPLTR